HDQPPPLPISPLYSNLQLPPYSFFSFAATSASAILFHPPTPPHFPAPDLAASVLAPSLPTCNHERLALLPHHQQLAACSRCFPILFLYGLLSPSPSLSHDARLSLSFSHSP
ncbi:hypothetical protein AMTR_s00033p00235440, partial [Amborella trichopoda]